MVESLRHTNKHFHMQILVTTEEIDLIILATFPSI